jgi:hypothetical protein
VTCWWLERIDRVHRRGGKRSSSQARMVSAYMLLSDLALNLLE